MTIDFSKSGVPRAANAFTLRDLQETCVAKGFKKADADSSKPLAQVADVHTFFTSLGVTSMSTFKKRFNEEKLPDPYPGMTPLIAEKVSARARRTTTSERTSRPVVSREATEGLFYFRNRFCSRPKLRPKPKPKPKPKPPPPPPSVPRSPHPALRPPPLLLARAQDKPKVEKITWDVPDVSEYYTLAGEWENMKWKLLPKPGGAVMKPEDWRVPPPPGFRAKPCTLYPKRGP